MSTINNFSKVDGFSGAQQVETVEGQVPAALLLALGKMFYADRDADRRLALEMMGQLMALGAEVLSAIKAEQAERTEQREAAERRERHERHAERMRQERREERQQQRRS